MNTALDNAFKHDESVSIISVRHFDAGDYTLSTAPGYANGVDGGPLQPVIPRAEKGVTVVKFFIRTTGEKAPSLPDPIAGTDVGFEIWFPDPQDWSGRILHSVDGGWMGSPHVTNPNSTASTLTATMYSQWASQHGYIAGTTNGGHYTPLNNATYSGVLDTSYLIKDGEYNIEGWKNIGWQATHLLSLKTREIASAYYDRNHTSAYLFGCSTAGRLVYDVAQRFPADYDGLLSIAPSFTGTLYYPSIGYPAIVVNNDGLSFTSTQLEIVSQKAVEHGDTAITGQHDGYITDWKNNHYDPEKDSSVLRVEDGGKCTDSWAISLAQARALNKIWYGVTPDGSYPDPAEDNGSGLMRPENQIYWGRLRGIQLLYVTKPSVIPSVFWPVAFLNESLGSPYFFPNGRDAWVNMTYDQFAQKMLAGKAIDDEIIDMNSDNPDIREFKRLGGKILTYHGLADPYSPPPHTVSYYEKSANLTGGMEEASDFHRLFLVPGMGHCDPVIGQAGQANIPLPQAEQFIEKLVSWVERDEAPQEILATSSDNQASRLICPYPDLVKYDGHGNVAAAESFYCPK
ncbi:tannase and feruloyl esterase [Corynespora cassiicola Philippines]|uniref:Carboxylic ester hydrolase n=1 Tax=Corynespora cassiicola Philippines TaxID=1448308 RepID=A0A2T2N2F7_CORCC|nr:tannase and feruloyl esterase [Corynespora cassiicola Philippines]